MYKRERFIIAPTLEQLKGHIALGLSVRPSIQNLRKGFEVS